MNPNIPYWINKIYSNGNLIILINTFQNLIKNKNHWVYNKSMHWISATSLHSHLLSAKRVRVLVPQEYPAAQSGIQERVIAHRLFDFRHYLPEAARDYRGVARSRYERINNV